METLHFYEFLKCKKRAITLAQIHETRSIAQNMSVAIISMVNYYAEILAICLCPNKEKLLYPFFTVDTCKCLYSASCFSHSDLGIPSSGGPESLLPVCCICG